MSTALLEAPQTEAVSLQLLPDGLDAGIEKLGEIRFLVVLTARWEGSDSIGRERRLKLRRDLARLRRQYTDQIDQIAMTFGVQQAIEAQEYIERTVKVPRGIHVPDEPEGKKQADGDAASDDPAWF